MKFVIKDNVTGKFLKEVGPDVYEYIKDPGKATVLSRESADDIIKQCKQYCNTQYLSRVRKV